jgi:pyruvate formate lyase activating enzyme
MVEARLYEKLPEFRVRCHTCQWRCRIAPGKTGVCKMYQNEGGTLYNMNYARASSIAVDPVEKKPLFHLYPGSLCFSLGGWGCNFHCIHCQNWEISCVDIPDAERGTYEVQPEAAIKMAKAEGCQGIAWTYNEPTMWFEYTLDSARLAHEAGLYSVYVTNGYATEEALDLLGPYLTAWRVDIKGFNDEFYKKLAKISHWRGILEVTKRAKDKWGMHVEVITNIIPGMNDDDEQLNSIARWIASSLGELTPWHVTRFYPQHDLQDLPATPVATIERAVDLGQKAGLKFIYAGNVPGHSAENTVCYNCHNLIVRRQGYQTEMLGLSGSHCKFCGVDLNFRMDIKGVPK